LLFKSKNIFVMKKHLMIFPALGCLLILASGCTKLLDVKPLNQITSDAVWKDASLMQAYVNNIYRGLGFGEFNSTSGLSDLDDESVWTNGAHAVVQSTITSSNRDVFGGSRFNYLDWGSLYSYIRQCNVFLTETTGSSVDTAQLNRMKGEVYFLRAYFYQNLMRTYGGVPLITKVYGLDDSTAIARNTFAETITFIVDNCDSAAALLPLSYSGDNLGRATRGAAMALKSRVLLYAASDLYNLDPSGIPELGYPNASASDRHARWEAAQEAAKAVMDLGIYHLYDADPAPGDSTAENYSNLFLSKTNDEVILSRFASVNNKAPNVGLWFSPNGYDGYGENSPIQQMVDAYEMRDGSKFSWNNPAEAAHPYQNRDPRFYATIFYDGARWIKRHSDAASFDPVGIIQTFKTITLPDGSTLPGIDTRNGPVENWNGSYSNYYLRKFVDPSNDFLSASQEIPWPFMRYAEILLNYAEASIELGQYQVARDALNQIRRRAGMPEFGPSLTGDQLMSEYRNERRVELAFECQRFFDIRRWMIAPKVMNEDAQGIEIAVKGKDRADRSTYYDYRYKVIDIQPRHWDDKMYFLPIAFDEMQRNPKLIQNPGF
jgi:hypothetical protein